jgi:hypothetical protein
MDLLDDDVLYVIFYHVSILDLPAAATTCRRWYFSAINGPEAWFCGGSPLLRRCRAVACVLAAEASQKLPRPFDAYEAAAFHGPSVAHEVMMRKQATHRMIYGKTDKLMLRLLALFGEFEQKTMRHVLVFRERDPAQSTGPSSRKYSTGLALVYEAVLLPCIREALKHAGATPLTHERAALVIESLADTFTRFAPLLLLHAEQLVAHQNGTMACHDLAVPDWNLLMKDMVSRFHASQAARSPELAQKEAG